MTKNWFIRKYLIISAICLIIAGFFSWITTRDLNYSGKDVLTYAYSGMHLEVSDPVVVEAASADEFDLTSINGSKLSGHSAPKPLGWQSDKYILLDKSPIQAGNWYITGGFIITFHITSENPVKVLVVWNSTNKVILWIFMLIVGLVVALIFASM
ncbi:MAG TPA: hypothetical protein VLI92_02970 [Candidatus Saccharimonadales bacterium]|nr:hypothetical protein [Candidatus Saccharimonadales bacterium]